MGGGRANIERQLELGPLRMKSVKDELIARGFEPVIISTNDINFEFNGNMIKVFPYSGWHQGKSIKPDLGLRKLYARLDTAASQPQDPEIRQHTIQSTMKKKENKNPMTFTLGIVAIIVGVALYKQFDPTTGSFEKPALAILYLIVFLAAALILIKNLAFKKR